jgi:subtilisin family serine protease
VAASRPIALLFAVLATGGLAGCSAPGNGWAERATQLDVLLGREGAGDGIRIAILDTGIDLGHPSLRHLANGDQRDGELRAYRDFVGGGTTPTDESGHGTFIAGLLVGRPAHGLRSLTGGSDVQGLVPDAELMVGRICPHGDCSLYVLRQGLEWALAGGADIISLSLGFETEELQRNPSAVEILRPLLEKAERRGVLVVAAAGNEASGLALFPAREPSVLAVGDVGSDLRPRHAGLCRSGKPDVLAPGEAIVGPALPDGLLSMKGSSAAVPFVVAAAAVLMAETPGWRDEDRLELVRTAIESTALHVDSACPGILQAEAARRAIAFAP